MPSLSCKCSTCHDKKKYNPASTSTGKKQNGTFCIKYGDSSTVSGPEYTDTVTVAGVSATNQYFSPVTTLSSSFVHDIIDGILGLAYPAISNLGQVRHWQHMDPAAVAYFQFLRAHSSTPHLSSRQYQPISSVFILQVLVPS